MWLVVVVGEFFGASVLDLLEVGEDGFGGAFFAVFADVGFFGFAEEDSNGLEGGCGR